MSECPSNNCSTRKSAPWFRRCVAKACLSVCGDKALPGIAVAAWRFNKCQKACRVIPPPRDVTNSKSQLRPASRSCLDPRWYLSSQAIASSPNGISRSFAPLPRTRITPELRSTWDCFNETSSDTRNPHAYSSSSIARSRTPLGCPVSGAPSKDTTSPSLRVFGKRLACFGASIRTVGSAEIPPFRIAYL